MEYDLIFCKGCWELKVFLGALRVSRASDLQLDVSPSAVRLQADAFPEFFIQLPKYAQVDVERCTSRFRRGELKISWTPAPASWSRECLLKPVSASPLIFVAENFLDKDTCVAIVEAARKYGKPVPMLGSDVKYDLPMWPHRHNMPEDQQTLLESVFTRIDALCGTARHAIEQPPRVHFLAERRAAMTQGPGTSPRVPSGLHIDTNGSPFRFATAIVYLETLPQPAGDGATVFPCVSRGASNRFGSPGTVCLQSKDISSTRTAAEALLNSGALHTANLPDKDFQPEAKVLVDAVDNRHGLSVYPEVGKLLLFFTFGEDGEVDPLSWHGGAAVGAGASSGPARGGKWILQVFKEVPGQFREAKARARYTIDHRCVPEFVSDDVCHKVGKVVPDA
mmetsp:Transcript_14245/g.26473  ORF Transcript_14245/g.26473 Transcript_14245/m.26473 type:complete len:393 (-) Transcript_14245:49-1227(-)